MVVVVGGAAVPQEGEEEESILAAAWKSAARCVWACRRVLRWRGEIVAVVVGVVVVGLREGVGVRRAMALLRSVRAVSAYSRALLRRSVVSGD